MKKRAFLGWMAGGAALALAPRFGLAAAGAAPGTRAPRLAAAWRSLYRIAPDGSPDGTQGEAPIDYVGIVEPDWDAGRVRIACAQPVTSRAHGLLADADGGFIACANRPGSWLMRCDAEGKVVVRHSLEGEPGERRLNGHVLFDPSGDWLLTTESEISTSLGFVSVRDRRTLRKEAEFSTAGIEPHEAVLDATGALVVANGGILRAAGDRKRDLDKMDSSLVRLDIATGKPTGRWSVADRRLSLRHLAVAPGPTRDGRRLVGVAMQAEHALASEREAAPVLAVWDGDRLTIPAQEPGAAGYCGDIAAGADGVFYLSAERANRVLRWHPDAPERLDVIAELEKSGALESGPADGALIASPRGLGFWHPVADPRLARWPLEMAPDNHWVALGA